METIIERECAGAAADGADVLHLVPGGYPVTIDVAQASIGGEGTAMHFALPLRGHNLPLMHAQESKLLVALAGVLDIRSGGRSIALLNEGDAVVLHAGIAHRVHQHGEQPSVAGVALWPGAVEDAFRALDAAAARDGYDRAAMIAVLAGYGISWDSAAGAAPQAVKVGPLAAQLPGLPPRLAAALRRCWVQQGARYTPAGRPA